MRRPERLHFAELFMQFVSMLDSTNPVIVTAGRQLLERLARYDPTWREEVAAVLAIQEITTTDPGIHDYDRNPE